MAAPLKRTYSCLTKESMFVDCKSQRLDLDTPNISSRLRNKSTALSPIRRVKPKQMCEYKVPTKTSEQNAEHWWEIIKAQEEVKRTNSDPLVIVKPCKITDCQPIARNKRVAELMMDKDESNSPNKRSRLISEYELKNTNAGELMDDMDSEICAGILKPCTSIGGSSSLAATISSEISFEMLELATELPTICEENVTEVCQWLITMKTAPCYEAKQLLMDMKTNNYMEQLTKIYNQCKNGNKSCLNELREIIYALTEITENTFEDEFITELFNEKNIHVLIDSYKHHPNSPGKNDDEDFVKKSKFHQPFLFNDPDLVNLIHHSHWLKYLEYLIPSDRGIILQHLQIIRGKNIEGIFAKVVQNKKLLCQLFGTLTNKTTGSRKKLEVFAFLIDLTTIILDLEISFQEEWRQVITNYGVLQSIDLILSSGKSKTLKLSAGKLLRLIMILYPDVVRKFAMIDYNNHKSSRSLSWIDRMMQIMTISACSNNGLAEILQDLFKLCLNPNLADKDDDHTFCSYIVEKMIKTIAMHKSNEKVVERLIVVFDILQYAFPVYYPVINARIISKYLLQDLMMLFQLNSPILTITVLDFMKTLLKKMDQSIARRIVKDDCLNNIAKLYGKNYGQRGLIGSKIVALIHLMVEKDNKNLTKQIQKELPSVLKLPVPTVIERDSSAVQIKPQSSF